MSDLNEQLEAARAEVARLEREAAAATCAEVGHRWKCLGGRNAGCDLLGRDCDCSVPVHECEVCGDCDYGENADAVEQLRKCSEDELLRDPDHEHRACEVCGAKTDEEAATRCVTSSDQSGERHCTGGSEEESYPDGRLRFISAIGLAKLDAWVDEQVRQDALDKEPS